MSSLFHVSLNRCKVPNPRPSSGLTSTSIDRAPGPSSNFVRGKSGYVPFWPGGLDDVAKDPVPIGDLSEASESLKTIPPGFTRGLRFPGDEAEEHVLPELKTAEKAEDTARSSRDIIRSSQLTLITTERRYCG